MYTTSDGEMILGMIMIHFEMKAEIGGLIHWINSLYVHPDYRRMGIFTSMYKHIYEIAKKDPLVKGVRLYVDKSNSIAK